MISVELAKKTERTEEYLNLKVEMNQQSLFGSTIDENETLNMINHFEDDFSPGPVEISTISLKIIEKTFRHC